MISNTSLHYIKEKIYKMADNRKILYNDHYMVGYITAIELVIAYIDMEIALNEKDNKIESMINNLKNLSTQ